MFLKNDEMKFAILYSLKVYQRPVSVEKLSELLTWDEDVMSYFDLAVLLSELIDDGFIRKLYYLSEESVELTEKGSDANDFFSNRVPSSIRFKIREFAKQDMFDEKTNPNAEITEVFPMGENKYMTNLKILDCGSPILEISIDMGKKAQADKAGKVLKKNAKQIYAYLCDLIDKG